MIAAVCLELCREILAQYQQYRQRTEHQEEHRRRIHHVLPHITELAVEHGYDKDPVPHSVHDQHDRDAYDISSAFFLYYFGKRIFHVPQIYKCEHRHQHCFDDHGRCTSRPLGCLIIITHHKAVTGYCQHHTYADACACKLFEPLQRLRRFHRLYTHICRPEIHLPDEQADVQHSAQCIRAIVSVYQHVIVKIKIQCVDQSRTYHEIADRSQQPLVSR